MQNIAHAMAARGAEGNPLPPILKRLASVGAVARRGQVSVISGAPGRGKSMLATHWAVNSGAKVLYFSMDTDRATLAARVLAGASNSAVSEVQEAFENEDESAMTALSESTSNIWFNFDPSPTIDDIYDELLAYGYVRGEWPELIVIDNVKDVAGGGSGENWEHWGRVVDECQRIARESSAHVAVLSHLKGAYENGNVMVPLGGLMGNIGKTPRLVLTVWQDTPGILNVSVVKNSSGRADPSGQFYVPVGVFPERQTFIDA